MDVDAVTARLGDSAAGQGEAGVAGARRVDVDAVAAGVGQGEVIRREGGALHVQAVEAVIDVDVAEA